MDDRNSDEYKTDIYKPELENSDHHEIDNPNLETQDEDIDNIKVNDSELPVEDLWEEIGFHKPIAGFWYNLTFSILSLLIGIFTTGILVNYFYPFPESNGYRNVTGGIFVVLFVIMDLGTHMTMDRFIGEAAIKNPEKMLNYIQYFIWYQAFTGLIQTTAVSIYALYFIPKTDLAYGIWLMLIIATYQYPGFLGVFGGVLGSLQQYNKTAILGFITGQGFQVITELLFVYLGRQYGIAHPEIGEIMGIAIGACIGVYIDDFFAMILSAWFFSKAMQDKGIRPRDCFRIGFDKELVKESMIFGVKTGAPGLIGVFTGLLILWIYLTYVPQYTTFSILASLMSGISGFINWGGVSAPTPLLAESYLNGKKKLTQFYISQTWRYILFFQFLFLPVIVSVVVILPKFFVEFKMENYMLAIPFFLPTLLRNAQQPLTSFADSIQLGTNHPNFLMGLRFAEEILKIVFIYLFVVILDLPGKYGIAALIWLLPCAEYPAILFKTITAYVYIHRKIIPLKINYYQTFFVPVVSGLFIFGILQIVLWGIFPLLELVFPFVVAIILVIFLLIIIILFGYLPLTALLGGWDTQSLLDFKRAAKMSGPSKWYVWRMYQVTEKVANMSKLHNKYPIHSEEAIQEARELLVIKKLNLKEFQQKNN
jgi:hypothetical protein